MKSERLLSLAVAVAAEQSVQRVLEAIVKGCAAQPDIALARIWLTGPGDICSHCLMRTECPDQTECLHLEASAGTPLHSPGEDWSFLDGHFRRMPIHAQKVGKVGGSGHAMLICDVSAEPDEIARPDWAKREQIRSFAGYPLIHDGNTLGVLAIFTRSPLDEQGFAWIKLFADQAAVAIANARNQEERNHAETARRASEANYRSVVETATDAVVSVDRDSQILFANSATAKMFGYALSELIGQSLTILMPEYLRELHKSGIERYLSTGQRHMNWNGTELIGLKKNGEEFPVEVSFGEIAGEGPAVFTGFIRDISARAQAEATLRESERRLRLLTETIPEMLWGATPDGAVDYVNQYVLDYTGMSTEQLFGGGWRKAVHPDYATPIAEAWMSSVSSGSPFLFEFRGLHAADQTYRWCVSRALPLRDQSGRIVRWYGTVTDLEDWKRAQEGLRESEEELRQLIEGIPQLIWRATADGAVDYHNERLLAYHGRPMDEMRGWGINKVMHPDDCDRALKIRHESLCTGTPFEFEARLLGREGQYRWFLVRGLPLHDSHGSVVKWYGTWTDIEKGKQTERSLELDKAYLQEQVDREFSEIVGQSPALKRVLHQIRMVAATDSNVLVLGESGTGKELVARAIHEGSRRRHHRLVSVNCASIPRELFESEFFGHAKGAFTGALRDRIGRFQLADKGTIFLDEVGEIPLELQTKLLRVLQEGTFERVGEDEMRRVDVRVVAATNRDLEQEVDAGQFRKDLYYRLCVFPLRIPPLRERPDDIPLLAHHFLQQARQRLNSPHASLSDSAIELLIAYEWPGNIRELQNVIERAVIVSQDGPLRIDMVFGNIHPVGVHKTPNAGAKSVPVLSKEEMDRRQRENILAALETARGKIYGPGGAAEILGMKATTLASRIKKMHLGRT